MSRISSVITLALLIFPVLTGSAMAQWSFDAYIGWTHTPPNSILTTLSSGCRCSAIDFS